DRVGAPELRAVLAGYVGRARGVAAAPESVVVCTGITQAIALLARALRRAGVTRVAVEDPGFPVHRRVFAAEGLRFVPIPVDGGGLVVEALDAADVGAVLVTPSHQFPLGMSLAPERRAQLVDWAAAREAWIFEDDYDGEYRFDRDPVGALQGLAPARVVYLGSASKTLAPALRLGWMIVPPGLIDAVADAKALADSGSPQLEQLALARFVQRGDLDRHLRRMRTSYRRRRDALVAGLDEHLPQLEREGSRPACTSPRACRATCRSGRCWDGRGRAASGSTASSTAASRGCCWATRTCPSRRCCRPCARWRRWCPRAGRWARPGWARRPTRAAPRTRARADHPGGGRRTSRWRGGRRRGSGSPRRGRSRTRARQARR
ncbi:MAG: PLP-dependent aminotransferase family protein, partial [Conexibacter sp.]|nr:PLP-dependent aminotransferase family protein [Conexibacter sp.]